MKILVERYVKDLSVKKIDIITNWADSSDIAPSKKIDNPLLRELCLQDRFIVQIAGNMGQGQAIELVFKCAENLKYNSGIHFLFIGSGSKFNWMQNEVRTKRLHNVTLLKERPRSEQNIFLNACDISIITLLPTMTGIGVPSRMYNVMAAGKPILGVVPAESELAMVIKEENIGWVVSPETPDLLSQAILEAHSRTDLLEQMGHRSRFLAENKYAHNTILKRYYDIINSYA
jgi:glycosyltransferase involved in cell wall biosynthesis